MRAASRPLAQLGGGGGGASGAIKAEPAGAAPAAGAALCDRLCFPGSAGLRRARLENELRGGGTAVHVSNGNLPWWWLLLSASICVPFQITFGILSLVLVPARVASIVGDEHKAYYLGVTVTIAMGRSHPGAA
jgi:hypothetical protein